MSESCAKCKIACHLLARISEGLQSSLEALKQRGAWENNDAYKDDLKDAQKFLRQS